MKRLMRLKTVSEVIGYGKSTIYDLIRIGQFPRPVRIGKRAVAWDGDEVQAWIAARIADRDRHGQRVA